MWLSMTEIWKASFKTFSGPKRSLQSYEELLLSSTLSIQFNNLRDTKR